MASQANVQFAKSRASLLLAVSFEPGEIGKRIRRARHRKGWTEMQFAQEANISISSVQRWQRGQLPPVRELIRVAEVLGIPTEELVEPEEQTVSLSDIRAQLAAEVARYARLNDRLERLLQERESSPPAHHSPHAKSQAPIQGKI